jgi:hypothetical protein
LVRKTEFGKNVPSGHIQEDEEEDVDFGEEEDAEGNSDAARGET